MLTRLRKEAPEAGVSLVDLLVSIMLMGMLLAMCVTAVVSGSRTTQQVQERTRALAGLEQAVQRAAKHLRAVSPLITATATGFTAHEVRSGTYYYVEVDMPVTGSVRQLRYREWTCGATRCTPASSAAPSATEVWLNDLLAPTSAHAGGQWFQWSSQTTATTVTTSPTPALPMSSVFSVAMAFRSAVPGLQPVESSTVVALRNSTASTDLT